MAQDEAGFTDAELEEALLLEEERLRMEEAVGNGRGGGSSFASRPKPRQPQQDPRGYLGGDVGIRSEDSVDEFRGQAYGADDQSGEFYIDQEEEDEVEEEWQREQQAYENAAGLRQSPRQQQQQQQMQQRVTPSDGRPRGRGEGPASSSRTQSPPPPAAAAAARGRGDPYDPTARVIQQRRLPQEGGGGYRGDYNDRGRSAGAGRDYIPQQQVYDDGAYSPSQAPRLPTRGVQNVGGGGGPSTSSSGAAAPTARPTRPGAVASTDDPKSSIKEQIQNELQQFERALRVNDRPVRGRGAAGERISEPVGGLRGYGSRQDDPYQNRVDTSSRRLPAARTVSRNQYSDDFFEDESINSQGSHQRNASRGQDVNNGRRQQMERTGSGRSIISRNVPRERDRGDGRYVGGGGGGDQRGYYDQDPRDRPRVDRMYQQQDYYGENDSLGGSVGAASYGAASLSRRELEDRLNRGGGSERNTSGGGYRGGGGGGSNNMMGGRGGERMDQRAYDRGDGYGNAAMGGPRQTSTAATYRDQEYQRQMQQEQRQRMQQQRVEAQRRAQEEERRQRLLQEQQQNVELEISPGVWMQLRGADETWSAVMNGAYCPAVCWTCTMNLLCVVDAEYVLCPECRVVGPIGEDEFGMRAELLGSDVKPHGVGLGFKPEDLMRWQSEMARGIDPRQSSFFAGSGGY